MNRIDGKNIGRLPAGLAALVAAACATVASLAAFTAQAQGFPSRPITLVVPFPEGGALDAVARPMAEAMRQQLGQLVAVKNVAGAGGTMGSGNVARAVADGDTNPGRLSAPRAGLRPARPPWGSRNLGAARRFLESL